MSMSTLRGGLAVTAVVAASLAVGGLVGAVGIDDHHDDPALQPVNPTVSPAGAHPTPLGRVALSPCTYEDSPGPCLWDARTRGDGQGTSFVAAFGQTWPVNPQPRGLGTVDGHPRCVGYIGDTTIVVCRDGWVSTS